MDTSEPLPLFHKWGHHIPRSDHSDRGSTPEVGRIGTHHGIRVGHWTAEALPDLVSQQILNTEATPQIDNNTLMPDDASESNRQDKGEGPKEEALIEIERMLERKRPRLQSGTKDLDVINLDGEKETQEIRIGKQMPSDLRQRLVELLKEYADICSWSHWDIPGLDTTIVEHRLPLIPNAVPVRQQL
ncbi:hypothetical protein CR513_50803, partial [Mucuna pruriens]